MIKKTKNNYIERRESISTSITIQSQPKKKEYKEKKK